MVLSEENLTNLLSLSYDEATTSHLAEVIAFYSFLFNDPDACPGCPGKVKLYWERLQQSGLHLLKNIDMSKQQESKFRISKGIKYLQMGFGSSTYFTNQTITDELAIEYLKANPNRISNFETYPDNWKELIGLEDQSQEEDTIKLFDLEVNIEDAIELFSKSEIETKATTAKGLMSAYEKATKEEKESLKKVVEEQSQEGK